MSIKIVKSWEDNKTVNWFYKQYLCFKYSCLNSKAVNGKTVVLSKSGRLFYRHNSDMGTVMIWNDNGVKRQTLILDAKYRSPSDSYCEQCGAIMKNKNTSIGPIEKVGKEKTIITDKMLNKLKIATQDIFTSKQNTDELMKNSVSSCAAMYCRSIYVNKSKCDLPNINTLCRIFAEREVLDSLDPTKCEYPDLDTIPIEMKDDCLFGYNNLKNWRINGNPSCWSSSWACQDSNQQGSYALCVTMYGTVTHLYTYCKCGIIPVLDLNEK